MTFQRWDPKDPAARNVDTFVLSKGHAAPILWAGCPSGATTAGPPEVGAVDDFPQSPRFLYRGNSVVAEVRRDFEAHEAVDTGCLVEDPAQNVARITHVGGDQLLVEGSRHRPAAAANGLPAANRLERGIDAQVFCLLGDGKCSEGSVWEAAQFASLNGLANIVAIVDVNGLGQSQATPYRHDTGVFARRFASFGWPTIEIDGRIKVRNPASVAVQREAWREFE